MSNVRIKMCNLDTFQQCSGDQALLLPPPLLTLGMRLLKKGYSLYIVCHIHDLSFVHPLPTRGSHEYKNVIVTGRGISLASLLQPDMPTLHFSLFGLNLHHYLSFMLHINSRASCQFSNGLQERTINKLELHEAHVPRANITV